MRTPGDYATVSTAGNEPVREPRPRLADADSDIRFRALFDRTSDGVFIYDLEGKIVDANQTAQRLTGFPIEELIGRSFLDAAAPEEQQRAAEVFAALLRGEVLDPYERVGRQKDGTEVIIEINAALVCDRSGKPHHVQSVVRDITERKRAEAALKDSEERFRSLVEHAPEAIVVLDTDSGRFVQVNENALRLFRCRREDLLGRLGPVDVSPPAQPGGRPSRDAAAEYVARAMDGETPTFEWTHRTLDGDDVLCEVRLARLARNLIRGSMTDISERKRAERERRQFEARVQQAQKLESLGVLAGGIAHDFNNLLVGVLGNATLALEELEEDHPVRDRLQQVDLAARRASELTHQLLTYAGKSRLKQELTDLNALLPELEELLGAAVSKKTTLRYELAPRPLFVLGDRSQLQQVAMNLITNASEAMGGRGGIVTVRTAVEAAGDAARGEGGRPPVFHVLEVADQGPGIDKATQGRILEPFFSTKFAGRGLGLATVSGIVRGHRGQLEIESLSGRGARFKVLLPAADGPREERVAAPAEPVEWRGEGTILVADDEELVRIVLAQHLEHLGFDVVFARDGSEAVASFKRHRDELAAVFLDQTMPVMDGVEAAGEIRRLDSGTPIVMLSGYAREEVASRIEQRGIADFIQKPFSLEDLRRTLRDLLG